jgi:hypothetical protein
MPPRWEDRVKGEWTGHSGVQSLALTEDGGVLAAGFAPRRLIPSSRVVCYDVGTGGKRWEWSSFLELEDSGVPDVAVEYATGIAIVRIQTHHEKV